MQHLLFAQVGLVTAILDKVKDKLENEEPEAGKADKVARWVVWPCNRPAATANVGAVFSSLRSVMSCWGRSIHSYNRQATSAVVHRLSLMVWWRTAYIRCTCSWALAEEDSSVLNAAPHWSHSRQHTTSFD